MMEGGGREGKGVIEGGEREGKGVIEGAGRGWSDGGEVFVRGCSSFVRGRLLLAACASQSLVEGCCVRGRLLFISG